jgi:phage tail sheath protein FI
VLVAALTEAAEAAYPPVNGAPDPPAAGIIENLIGQIGSAAPAFSDAELTEALAANMPGFARLLDHIAARRNILPPSAAMAGLYTAIDDSRGVWKAPANIGFAGRVSPCRT